ncbi:MAG: tetratricopeptide repeat protein, partial [Planctomycetes bacterium]|nr:tetratricopeptide repeat protein [Planctomycetota bacterium]
MPAPREPIEGDEPEGAAADAGGAEGGADTGVAPAADVGTLFEAARRIFKDGDAQSAFFTLRRAFARDPGYARLYPLAAEVAGVLGAVEEAKLFKKAAKRVTDPVAIYALGMHFVHERYPDLAIPFLLHVLRMNPPDEDLVFAAIRHLGYASVDAGRYADAIGHLEKLLAAEREDHGDLLALVEALIAERRAGRAAEVLARLERSAPATAPTDATDAPRAAGGAEEEGAEVAELRRALERLREFPEDRALGLREWHYVQHRGALIDLFEDARPAGGRFVAVWLTAGMVGRVLAALRALLAARGVRVRRVLAANARAEPLAEACARLHGVPWAAWSAREA